MRNMKCLSSRFACALVASAAMGCVCAVAQTSPAAAAAAAGSTSTSANGGTGGVGLGGSGPATSANPGSSLGAGASSSGRAPGNGALVGPRAKRQAQELLADNPDLQNAPPRNSGQRALLLDRERRDPIPSK